MLPVQQNRSLAVNAIVYIVLLMVISLPAWSSDIQTPYPQNWPAGVLTVLQNTEPLKFSRGQRLPLYLWRMAGSLEGIDDANALTVIKLLNDRGIAMIAEWDYDKNKEKILTESLRIASIQKKLGLLVNVNANNCFRWIYNGDPNTFHIDVNGKRFFDDSFEQGRMMGCPFAVKFRFHDVKEKFEYFLRAYKEKGINVDFIFADWEVDGPIEWNGAWENSKKCTRCQANIKNINDFTEFQKTVRIIRSQIQREVFADIVKSYFSSARVGNYAVYPCDGFRYWYDYFEKFVDGAPYKADQKAKYRQWFNEFPLTGYTFAMPVAYAWYPTFNWYNFENTDYRWFYNMLLVANNACKSTPRNIPIVTIVHRAITAPPKNADPSVKGLSVENYKELLWHILLRRTDGLSMWCMRSELASEVKPLQEVYAAALEFKDFLDEGEPISFEVPNKPAPVISGLRLGNKVLIRRTDFTLNPQPVEISVAEHKLTIPPLQGSCRIFELQ